MIVRADLHNHSCLSPCGDLHASPSAIARTAATRGIDLMALTDHNSARNSPAFGEACRRFGIEPLFGMEVTSREEVHLLALFGELEQALEFDREIYRLLPDIPNDPHRFGDQVVVDIDEVILEEVPRFLLTAVEADIDEIGSMVHAAGGLFIPAHADRASYSMTSQLGFLPDGAYDAVEITVWPPLPGAHRYALECSSDAHYLEDVGRRTTTFEAEAPSFAALKAALSDRATTLSISS